MKRVFLGLTGILFGSSLIVPTLLMGETFRGTEGSLGPLPLALQMTGAILLVGTPLLYWVVLPLLERHQRKREEL
ncbi:MAG: hypothetical protein ABEJ62_00685 [Candidatus Nanohaloarchaea archaeon]